MTTDLQAEFRFAGAGYDPARDDERLTGQIRRVFDVMRDGKARTLQEIEWAILERFIKADPQASISAQLRHLRKPRFGGHTVEREHLGGGLFTYRLIVNEDGWARPKNEN